MATAHEITGLTMKERFDLFHHKHPEVYTMMRDICVAWKDAGGGKWSTRAAIEVLRWQLLTKYKGDMGYKINDHFTAPYARLLMAQEHGLEDMFQLRELTAA